MPKISLQNDETVIWPPARVQNDGTFHLASKNALKIPENLLKFLEIPQDTKKVSNVLIQLPNH